MTSHDSQRGVRLFLVRHGVTDWNLEGRYTSTTDIELHDSARRALEPTARLLAPSGVRRVLTSPMKRAVATVEILRELGAVNVPHEVVNGLRELDFGQFEGRSGSEMRRGRLADAYAQWMRVHDGFSAPPGGEGLASASARARRVLDRVAASGENTLAVSHGYLLRILVVTAVRHLPVSAIRSMPLANGSVTELRLGDGEWRLESHNEAGDPAARFSEATPRRP